MSEPGRIRIEVAYALAEKQAIVALEVARGTTALEAARLSAIADRFGGLDLDNARLGIWAKVVSPTQVLREGDRVEIYRPLIADPKEVRKERAARARVRRSKDGEG
jgi:putative ubiquitin-RnfH superfamily antitoxin RatB of RatAB toxin-antitoxin module